jgi:hypothetical protein
MIIRKAMTAQDNKTQDDQKINLSSRIPADCGDYDM